jgi:hypothetical protein
LLFGGEAIGEGCARDIVSAHAISGLLAGGYALEKGSGGGPPRAGGLASTSTLATLRAGGDDRKRLSAVSSARCRSILSPGDMLCCC